MACNNNTGINCTCTSIPHVLVMANAVNAFHITAEVAKCRDASFPYPVKKLMIGQSRISTRIIKK